MLGYCWWGTTARGDTTEHPRGFQVNDKAWRHRGVSSRCRLMGKKRELLQRSHFGSEPLRSFFCSFWFSVFPSLPFRKAFKGQLAVMKG